MSIDRPLECTECKKETKVIYTDVSTTELVRMAMCETCPALANRYACMSTSDGGKKSKEPMGLCCATCRSTLEDIRMGHPLGCAECYEVFCDLLLSELRESLPYSSSSEEVTLTKPIHIGRNPGETTEINPSMRLLALNEALAETLSREDYEQAAWIRDQIQELKNEQQSTKKKSTKQEAEE